MKSSVSVGKVLNGWRLATLLVVTFSATSPAARAAFDLEVRPATVRVLSAEGRPVAGAVFRLSWAETRYGYRSDCYGGDGPLNWLPIPGLCWTREELRGAPSAFEVVSDVNGELRLPAGHWRSRSPARKDPLFSATFYGIQNAAGDTIHGTGFPECLGHKYGVIYVSESSAPSLPPQVECRFGGDARLPAAQD